MKPTDPEPKTKRRPRPAPTVVLGLPSLLLEQGQFDQEAEARRVVVVEPISVREDLASAMTGIPVETLRQDRKLRIGCPCKKKGTSVLYVVKDLRAYVESLQALEMAE